MYVEFKEGQKHASKDADLLESTEKLQDAGYVLTDDDLIIDIDDIPKDVIRKMITTFDIKTQVVWTDRGAHLYFIKPKNFKGAKCNTALGFPVEFKHKKNTKFITVKRNGVLRKVENENFRQELPEFLSYSRRYEELYGMDDGDGRNQALFTHRSNMRGMKNWQKIMEFINETIFAEPLPQKEMEVLLRDVRVDPKSEDAESAIATLVMKEYHTVLFNEVIWWLKDDEFVTDENELVRIVYQLSDNQKTRFVDEVMKQIRYRSPIVPPDTTFDLKLNNGILRDGKFVEVNYKEFTPFHIDIDYKPEAPAVEIVDDYINHLVDHDAEYRKLLFEILGHTLIVDDEFKRMVGGFFIFVGDGGNGKGTLLSILRQILNGKNCTALSIQQMGDERYFTTMKGKLANLGDDIQDEAINHEQMKTLKNISTCDYVATRELYKQSEEAILTLSLIFTSNHILKSFEKGESYRRRVKWLPMYSKPTKKDPKFISKLTSKEALEYWMKLIFEGYQRLYQNGKFTDSERISKFNNEYHQTNNTTLEFIKDFEPEYFVGKRTPEIYEGYETWAEENGLNVQSKKMLKETIEEHFGMEIVSKKINKKTSRVFAMKKFEGE